MNTIRSGPRVGKAVMLESRAAPIAGACRTVPQPALSKQSRHKRRLQASSSTYTLKREKFRETMYSLNMTTVDVPGVIIPSCHILHEQILCSATMAYNILGLCKCAIIAIYHIGVGYTVVRSAV